MKRDFVMLILLITLSVVRGNSQTDHPIFSEKNLPVDSFTKLIVKSKLRIVLVESDQLDSIRIEGNNDFADKVFVVQSGKKLFVRSASFKDLKKEGTIYIPVRSLQSIEVLDDAKIISFSIINSPSLDLLIQGDCTVSIILKGKLNIVKGEDYTYSFRRITENSNTPTYQQSIFNH
jgi:hypothetical protein